MILATYGVLLSAVRKIASWFVSFNTEHVWKHSSCSVGSDYICRTTWNNIVKLHVTILLVSCYIHIYIYIYI